MHYSWALSTLAMEHGQLSTLFVRVVRDNAGALCALGQLSGPSKIRHSSSSELWIELNGITRVNSSCRNIFQCLQLN